MKTILGYLKYNFRKTYSKILGSAAARPGLALTLVLLVSTLVLPLVSAVALVPLVALFHFGNYVETKGLGPVLYATCIQGLLLTSIITILYVAFLVVVAGANLVHIKVYASRIIAKEDLNWQHVKQKNKNFALF